ncbi:TonB-dependent receptor [Bacteroides intestinalis]|uniref:TonB-dependent receptor n=1 Tax=Bacteroides intestinalis TaxID=329854 RepID=A0A412Y138_9BACE|nr:TonB-dependent receptor [Bacteroides intestinalis]RGV51242.1 TonB-dependent receptor [Bacteroides intestinalis]RHA62684.1 TonB-dependent receptor [Bacteroides intestinalis]
MKHLRIGLGGKTVFTQLFILVLFAGISMAAHAQTVVKGNINDPQGEPVIGASVIEKGTSNGVITDFNGNFSLNVTSPTATLLISYVGYVPQEVSANGTSPLKVVMVEDSKMLDEIVVIGYGVQRKGDVTSSVASVKAESFNKGMSQDIGQLIQGKVAGLSISLTSGDPTASTQMLLRGRSTINGSNTNPLVIIDGVPGDFGMVSPEDIESIDVLKDGSAAAIYGTRGTNGVIIITTKRANESNFNKVEYNAYVYTQTIASKMDMLTASDYRQQIADGFRDTSWDKGQDTDWLDQITRTPISHVHNLSFTGGNRTTNYLLNVNFRQAQGIFKKSDNQRLNVRAKVNHKMFDDKLTASFEILNTQNKYSTTGDGTSFNGFVYRQAQIMNPTAPVKSDNGAWYEETGLFQYENPVARIQESDGENEQQFSRLNANITYTPISDLTLTGLFSFSKYNQTRGYAETKNHISNIRDSKNGFASNGQDSTKDLLMELTAQYQKKIGAHNFSLLGGYSYSSNQWFNFWVQNQDFPTDIFGYSQIQLGEGLANKLSSLSSNKGKTNLIGFFGRATYSFKDRYLFMGSLRYEGASQLVGTDNEWGLFPSVSFGWRLSEESFIKSLNIFDDLKLRIGYGVTGSQPKDSFLGKSTLSYSGYFLSDGKWVRTLVPSRNPNPNLKWEEKHEWNVGLDFSVLNHRISGSVDYYNREIKDLLYNFSVPVPPNLVNTTMANVGKLRNRGLEILVNLVPVQTKNFTWSTSINFSTNNDKLVSLSNDLYEVSSNYIYDGWTGDPIQTSTHRIEIGGKIGNFFGYKVVDVDENGKWIYLDGEGNRVGYDDFVGMRNNDNKHVLGNGLPKYYAGWNNNLRYKNWDLGITMRGAFDYQILNFQRMYYENTGIMNYNRLKSSKDKVFGKAVLSKEMPLELNSYYIENGDFWKIDNITVGYNFKKTGTRFIKSIRVYGSCSNALTLTGYKGIDPEVNRVGLSPGNDDRDKYPTTRTFTIGTNIVF